MTDAMKDDTLKALLADYAAPTHDDGFSDAVMRELEAELAVESLDVEAFKPAAHPVRRSWLLSLVMGLIVGLLWMRLGISLPEIPDATELPQLLQSGWGLYALVGIGLAGLFVFVEAETY